MPVRLATLFALLALAGCGSAGAPAQTDKTNITITLDDYTIRPQDLRVDQGKRLTFTVVNHGRLGHTFRIRGKNHVVFSMTTIPPGDSKTRSTTLGPGTYTMFCVLANHEELGMTGKLHVR